jgi:hypothetical protein
MNKENKTMPNVVADTSVSDFVSFLGQHGVTVTIADKNGNALSDTSFLGTGCTVTDSKGNVFTVIICGDVDGSGKVDSTDYLQIKKVFLGELSFEGAYYSASDANGDGIVNSTDYLRIKSYFLGLIDLYE